MVPEHTISGLYESMLALHKGVENHDDLCLSARLDEYDRLDIHIYDKQHNYNIIWDATVKHISENLIGGFIAVGRAAGFIDGYDKAHEVEFIEDKEAA